MTKPSFIFPAAVLFIVCFIGAVSISAQASAPVRQAEPNYEAVLHVLSASNNASADSAAAPQALSNVVRKLKSNYAFTNYRVTSTYFQRVANAGNMEFKGVSTEPNQDAFAPVFVDWTLGQLQNLPDAKGQNSIQIQNFRFGQRVPVRTSTVTDASGKTNAVVNYEYVGLSMQKIGLPLDTPIVIGNLHSSKPGEMAFLVLTVKPVD